MMRDERSLVASSLVILLTACSAGQGQKGGSDSGGSSAGGSSATGNGGSAASVGGTTNPNGGGSAMSGAAGTNPSGGASGSGNGGASGASGAGATTTGGASGNGNGGASGAGAVPPGGDAGMGGQVACQDLTVVPTPVIPTVLILVDNSSSMFETMPPAWPDLKAALMDPGGPVETLQEKIRFGFVSYKGATVASTEGAAACADMTNRVLPALNNHAAIKTVYDSITWSPGTKWETPTGHAIGIATGILAADNPMPPSPKFILLVTDGNPNTCATLDPQCGQDIAIRAAQTAFAPPNDIQTIVFGVGDIVAQPNNGCPTSGRCGSLHLQDMANAGVGNPVQAPADNFRYESCNIGQMLTATYLPQGMAATVNEPFSTASNRAELAMKLSSKLTNVVSCTIQLDATVNATADPALARITVGGAAVPYNTMDGWILESTRDKITLQGAACTTFREGAPVNVVFPCQNGRPIGM
jgi:hypothetical protein